jgi:DNA-binding MarR family transcriptional regulator
MAEGRVPGHRVFPASLMSVRAVIDVGGRLSRVAARRAGLSDSELAALEHLAAEPLGPAELARRLTISTAAATGVVDRLEQRGHVERRPHAADRRRVAVSLTDSGYADLRARLSETFDALLVWDAGFDEDERALVARYLEGVVGVLDAAAHREAAARTTPED